MSTGPEVTARTWGPVSAPWDTAEGWVGEWMTIGGETWFSRIHADGDPDLPPIVMIHGLVVSGDYFRPVADLLDSRYTIYVPDLPGYGRSRSDRLWTFPSLVTHIASWLDAHGLSDVILVGNSLGSQAATLLATLRPDLVRSMILIGPTLDPAVRNRIHVVLRGAMDIPREKHSIWTLWVPDLFRAGLRRAFLMLGQMFEDDQLARLGDVRQPALVIVGECDPIAPPAWGREMASRMPCGEAVTVPEAAHALNYSNAPELVAAIDRARDLPV